MLKGMDLTIKGYRAWVEYVKGQPAFGPWYKESQLVVWISIESPHAVSGFGVSLPLKEYTPEEFKRLVEEDGSHQFDKIIAEHDAERQKNEYLANQKKEAQDIARKVAKAVGVECLEDTR